MFNRKKVALKELQSLLGLLNFACLVVVPGKVFLWRLINLTISILQWHHLIRLTLKAKKDLNTWETFLGSFNVKSFFLEEGWTSSYVFSLMQLNLVVMGLYLVSSGHMVHGHTHGKTTILVSSSFFPIVLGLSLWCRELWNKHVMFNTDNESTVYVINKETVKDTKLLSLLHMLVLICLQNNIFFRARLIEGGTEYTHWQSILFAGRQIQSPSSRYEPTVNPISGSPVARELRDTTLTQLLEASWVPIQ